MQHVGFEQSFMFAYSLREKTPAHRRFEDDVDLVDKKRRLAEVIATYRHFGQLRNQAEVGYVSSSRSGSRLLF